MRYIILVLALIGLGVYINQRGKAPEPGPQPLPGISEAYEKKTPAGLPDEAWKFYGDAKDAVYDGDYARAEKDLSTAVSLKPDFTEAYYNLGATQANMAIEAASHDYNTKAVLLFRKAVENKKKARELMKQNIWYEYEGEQQTQTRAAVEQALADADEVLDNEGALIDALHLWAQNKYNK